MTQLIDGTISVTLGSQAVSFAGSPDLSGIDRGHILLVADEVPPYFIHSVDNVAKTAVIVGVYIGEATASGLAYSISTSATSPENIPYPEKNDIEIASIFKQSAERVQAILNTL